MSASGDVIGAAVLNIATDVRVVGLLMVLVAVQVLGPRLIRQRLAEESLAAEVEGLDREAAFHGLGGDAGEFDAAVNDAVEANAYSGWQSSWNDARGDGDFVVPNDLLGGVMTIDLGAVAVEVAVPDMEESLEADAEIDLYDIWKSS